MASRRSDPDQQPDPHMQRARELAAHARNLAAMRKAKALAMRQADRARCGNCIFWQAASAKWMRDHGRGDWAHNALGWTGWCTGDPHHAPRQRADDPRVRQDYDLPCGQFLPYLDSEVDPAA